MEKQVVAGRRAIFTICCRNYIAFAATLMDSIRSHNADCDRYVILCEDSTTLPDGVEVDASIVAAVELGIANFKKMAFGYNLIELNTCIKPSAIKHLLSKGYAEVMYLDPDIEVFAGLHPLWPSSHDASTVLTPHITSPIADRFRPSDVELLANGLYNLGFVSVTSSAESLAFLDWWENKCQTVGFDDKPDNLFVDQKFCDLVPLLFKGVYVSGHLGANVAYWNLHERLITEREGVCWVNGNWRLLFYHYSGIGIVGGATISKHTDRFTLDQRNDLKPLFDRYRANVTNNGHSISKDLKYSYGYTTQGEPISNMERLMFLARRDPEEVSNPFDRSQSKNKQEWYLRSGRASMNSARPFAPSTSQRDRFLLLFLTWLLKCLCWLMTPSRYSQLCSRLEKAFRLRMHVNLLNRRASHASPVALSLRPRGGEPKLPQDS